MIVRSFVRNQSGELLVDGVSLEALAKQFGTPCYVYSKRQMLDNYGAFSQAFAGIASLICVSVKACSNLSLLKILAQQGAGFDIVSGGELKRVIAAGGDPRKVVFAGVAKSDDEIRFALDQDIRLFNVESLAELERINDIALESGCRARIALRVNPDVDAKTHHHINTGMEQHKFGVPISDAIEVYKEHQRFPGVEFAGIDCHIGSMITDMDVFREAFGKLRIMVQQLAGAVPALQYVDIGGGFGISYSEAPGPEIGRYASVVDETLGDLGLNIILEPGRAVFATAALLLSRVVYLKHTEQKEFVILDAGFNDLIRPVLYDAYHEIEPVISKSGSKSFTADIVGPVCETADCFAKGRSIGQVERGDLVVIRCAGAYGFVMASNYNTRPRPPEVLVADGTARLIRPREQAEELYEPELKLLEPK